MSSKEINIDAMKALGLIDPSDDMDDLIQSKMVSVNDDCETEMIKLQNALKELEYSEHHKQEYTYRKNKPNKGFSLGSYKYKR